MQFKARSMILTEYNPVNPWTAPVNDCQGVFFGLGGAKPTAGPIPSGNKSSAGANKNELP
jgi:hypothetical protein